MQGRGVCVSELERGLPLIRGTATGSFIFSLSLSRSVDGIAVINCVIGFL